MGRYKEEGRRKLKAKVRQEGIVQRCMQLGKERESDSLEGNGWDDKKCSRLIPMNIIFHQNLFIFLCSVIIVPKMH